MNQPNQIKFWEEERENIGQTKLMYSYVTDFW
jgi:hypothetical protein